MTKLKMGLAAFVLIAFGGLAVGQGQGLFGPFPVVGGAAYCSSTNNGVCTNTVPAGPLSLTGNEGIIANTNLSQGRSPQNVLITPSALGANPLTFPAGTATPAGISASNVSGGVVYTHSTTITAARITLPTNAINGQTYVISANQTITTLNVEAAAGDSMAANSAPTVLTASTTVPQGYKFVCSRPTATAACTWYRLQ